MKEKAVRDPREVLMQYACLLFSLCVHEAAHAAMADRCGDPSARMLGRLTLNPLKHIDPFGTVILPLVGMFTGFPYLFGYAKPVPVNFRNLRNPRRDDVLVSLAGPMSNFMLAVTAALVLRVVAVLAGTSTDFEILHAFAQIFSMLMIINMVLMLFNLIPVPPLDGHYLLNYFLPPSAQEMMSRVGPYGILIVILLVSQLRILDVPMRLLAHFLEFIAFYGTPLWGSMG
jgi:Zn-dependent protease